MLLSIPVSDIPDPGEGYFWILFWGIVILFTGRTLGKSIDKQYREPEGKPRFIRIPYSRKWLFHFEYFLGTEVVMEGLAAEILGYVFTGFQLCLLVIAVILDNAPTMWAVSYLLLLGYLFFQLVVIIPMMMRYSRNIHKYYDSDWITSLQQGLGQLPKRRCKVAAQLGEGIYEITLGTFGIRGHLARSSSPVPVGASLYAVHYNEQGSPFWTIRDH